MHRFLPLLVVLLPLLGTPSPSSASESSASVPLASVSDFTPPAPPSSFAPPATHPAASVEHPWLVSLSALLVDRYRVTGDLRLAWHRPLPAAAPRAADLELVSAPAVLAPQILVHVRARDAAGAVSEHSLLLRAELWREGFTLRQPAAVGSPLVIAALEPRLVDTLRERDVFTLDASNSAAPGAAVSSSHAEAPELDFARAVPAGRVLVWRDVYRRPLVRRGQPVDVVASDGALSVSLRGVALHDAARGDPVRVRNPDSKREFVATVTAESRAAVRF